MAVDTREPLSRVKNMEEENLFLRTELTMKGRSKRTRWTAKEYFTIRRTVLPMMATGITINFMGSESYTTKTLRNLHKTMIFGT